jgi:cytochrome c oxidase assembly factor CtaG
MPVIWRWTIFFACATAFGHEGEPLAPHDVPGAWVLDIGTVAPLLISAVMYLRGATDAHGIVRWERRCFWAGWWALLVALVSPIHPMGEALFSAHMVQHEILMLVAAPLLVLGRPLVPFLWGLPMSWRRVAALISKSTAVSWNWSWLSRPVNAWWIHAVALWGWHAPRAFQAAVGNEFIHALQHISFLGTALLFWWALIRGHDAAKGYGKAVLYVFTTGVHSSILGAWLTFSPMVWYPIYADRTKAWNLTPLEDQQIGGLIMWVPPGLVFIAAGLYFFSKWIEDPPDEDAVGQHHTDDLVRFRS